MTIKYKDFFATLLSCVKAEGFFDSDKETFEDLSQVLARMNDWLVQSKVRVINIETILRPTALLRSYSGSTELFENERTAALINTRSESDLSYEQFFRCWFYEE